MAQRLLMIDDDHRLGAMVETVLNAFREQIADDLALVGGDAFVNHIAAKRQR